MIEIKKVYKANNGDVFLIKESDYKEHTEEEIKDLLERAKEMYINNQYEKCTCKIGKTFGLKCYYDEDENFIGNGDIHILKKFSSSQNGVYLINE